MHKFQLYSLIPGQGSDMKPENCVKKNVFIEFRKNLWYFSHFFPCAQYEWEISQFQKHFIRSDANNLQIIELST